MRNVIGRGAAILFWSGIGVGSAVAAARAQDTAAALPDLGGRSIVLTNAIVPPGGTVLPTVAGWHVYGEIDGVPYRYAEADPTTILVANHKGISRFMLTKQLAWRIRCFEASGGNLNCSIQSPPTGDGFSDDGLATIGNAVCEMFTGHVLMIPAPASTSTRDGTTCIMADKSDRILRDLTAGRNTVGHVSGFGYAQARVLRDWVIERYKSGDLAAK